MFPAPQILAVLVITTPIILVSDALITYGIVSVIASVSVAIIALRVRPGEATFLWSVIDAVAFVAAIPAICMLIQILPLPDIPLANPVWQSAASALGRPLAGSISIDPGATLIVLAQYLSTLAIGFVAAAIAIDRHRAERILLALTTATTVIALMLLATGLGIFAFISVGEGGAARNAATNCAALGVVFAATALLHFGTKRVGSTAWLWVTFASFVAVVICSLAVISAGTSQTQFAVICGVATLAIVVVIRIFQLGPWGCSAIVAIVFVLATSTIVLQPNIQSMGLTLAFAKAPEPLIAVTQAILADVRWGGTGAGTFSAVVPIYGGFDAMATGAIAPNALSAMIIEMGRPFFWAAFVATIIFIISLLRSAVQRGRDFFYAAAGAACVVTITLLAFSNAIFSAPIVILVATALGIATAQSKSRSARSTA